MQNQLTIVEPLPFPDVQRPGKLSSLPPWVRERLDILKETRQPDNSGEHRQTPALPKAMLLGDGQKAALRAHVARLDDVAAMRPDANDAYAQKTLVAVSKMLMTLAGKESGGLIGEARGEAYMAALEDIPYWAVEEAIRHWYRGECGQQDYRWPPDPAKLRGLAVLEAGRVRGIARSLTKLIAAEELVEFSDEHCAAMRAKLAGIGLIRV